MLMNFLIFKLEQIPLGHVVSFFGVVLFTNILFTNILARRLSSTFIGELVFIRFRNQIFRWKGLLKMFIFSVLFWSDQSMFIIFLL